VDGGSASAFKSVSYTTSLEEGVQFREGEMQKFVCHVNGSNPAPEVHVFLGSEDITTQFNRFVLE